MALHDILAGPSRALAATGPGQTAGLGYFTRFGVSEKLIQDALGTALGSGGDHADVFFQHQVQNVYGLEDGQVNRAYADVQLGVGVRGVTGDQTGYGFTEELTPEGLKLAAQTAAAIATGPARPGPQTFRAVTDLPSRYAVETPWEDVRPEGKLPILTGLNEKVFAADPRVKKARVFFVDQSSAILMATSDGRIVEDLQPMTLCYVTCVAEQDGKREEAGSSVAARDGITYYTPERIDSLVMKAQ